MYQYLIHICRDDTFLASTVLWSAGLSLSSPEIPPNIVSEFQLLQDSILRLLDAALKVTPFIFVITNAEVFYFLL